MWMQVYVIFPEKGGIHMGDNKKRRPPAFLRPLVHFTCFWRMSCLDCVNRDGPDCDCELLDKDGARIMACWWRWNPLLLRRPGPPSLRWGRPSGIPS